MQSIQNLGQKNNDHTLPGKTILQMGTFLSGFAAIPIIMFPFAKWSFPEECGSCVPRRGHPGVYGENIAMVEYIACEATCAILNVICIILILMTLFVGIVATTMLCRSSIENSKSRTERFVKEIAHVARGGLFWVAGLAFFLVFREIVNNLPLVI